MGSSAEQVQLLETHPQDDDEFERVLRESALDAGAALLDRPNMSEQVQRPEIHQNDDEFERVLRESVLDSGTALPGRASITEQVQRPETHQEDDEFEKILRETALDAGAPNIAEQAQLP